MKKSTRSPFVILDFLAILLLASAVVGGCIYWYQHSRISFVAFMGVFGTIVSIAWLVIRATEKDLFS